MKYESLDQLFEDVHEPFKPAVQKIRKLFLQHKNVREMLQRNAFVFKRDKDKRAYLNVYKKKQSIILGFGHGAAMVKQEPMLVYAFDEVKTVVAKVEITSLDQIEKKSIAQLIDLAIHYSINKKREDE